MNAALSILFQIVYLYLNYQFSVNINYATPMEQVIGIALVVSASGAILDALAYIIAYRLTGVFTSGYEGKHFRSMVH